MRVAAAVMSVLLAFQPAEAETPRADRAGDVYRIRMEKVSEYSSNGSSGSSHDVWTLQERVIALRDGGIELEFDLPEGTSSEDSAREWKFPVRIFEAHGEPVQLLNATELEARVKTWLASGGLTEADCGRWIFTWNAFKIECDPQSVLQSLQPFDLRQIDLREGARYMVPEASEPVALRAGSNASGESILLADLVIDPEQVRRARAATDMAAAQMLGGPPVTLDDALLSHADDIISGTIAVTITADLAGQVTRLSSVTNVQITVGGGTPEVTTTTVTMERELVSQGPESAAP